MFNILEDYLKISYYLHEAKMKRKNIKVGTKVFVYAAFPEGGAFYSGAEGKVVDLEWAQGDFKEDPVKEFLTVKLEGSGDVICVHHKQCRAS